jgi:cation-transporting ATPase 13A3/4/5
MLTGESVPVGKTPAGNEDIAVWKDSEDVPRESAKSFLYFGTRIVRARGSLAPDGSTRNPAVGLVVRTGMSRLVTHAE